ncbi:stem cell self-renewal protein Piwi, partial [Patellaria atrata CBS 101060]
ILIILPFKEDKLYGTVKRFTDLKRGLLTVCFLAENVLTHKSQHLSGLALKFNLKLGGINYTLPAELFNSLYLEDGNPDALILGADVYHPPPDDHNPGLPSAAAVVGSFDNKFMNYLPSLRLQAGNQEMNLKEMVVERLRKFGIANPTNLLPFKILMYRDGVGDNQFQTLRETEIPTIYKAFETAKKNWITHRSETRGTLENKELHNGNDRIARNVTPGTVIDTALTHPDRNSFYLQAHAASQGTVRSIYCHIIHNTASLTLVRPSNP